MEYFYLALISDLDKLSAFNMCIYLRGCVWSGVGVGPDGKGGGGGVRVQSD